MRLTRSLRLLFAFSVILASLLAGTAARADDAPTAPLPPSTPPSTPTMYVHVTSPSPVLMQRRTAGTRRWTTACTSPCDVDLPTSDKGKVSAARTVGGSALFIGGGALAIMGTIGVVGGIAVTAATCTPTPSEQERCDWFIGGPGLGVPVIVVSALVLLGGVTMMVAGSSMWSPPSTPKAAKPPVANTAFVREPTWTVATPASPAKARPFVVPLTLSF